MPNRPSIMEHRFSAIPQNPLVRSSFQRNFLHKTTCDSGYIVPVLLQEILPGDTVSMTANFFGRISTLQHPIMDNVWVDSFAFFVPNRLVWANWQKFQGERLNPGDSIDYEVPYLSGNDPATYQFVDFGLGDYFGLPVGKNIDPTYTRISALPFRGYWLIRDEWFRDQNLQDRNPDWNDGDGPDEVTWYDFLARRGKRHDIFTSCLPWPQNGDEVKIPLGTDAAVIGTGDPIRFYNGSGGFYLNYNDNSGFSGMLGVRDTPGTVGGLPAGSAPTGDVVLGIDTNPSGTTSGMIADLSNATAASINALREAFATQQYLELLARGGSRYVEQIRALWGVQVPDFRLQRPEYVGGSSDPIDIRQVAQTSPTSGTDAMASLAANGQFACRMRFHHSFVEHGYLFVLLNLRADLTYQNCIDKHWTRSTRYDFYLPPFSHIGEQPIYQREIYYDPADEANPTVFGYQEAWAHYRYARSYVSGAFRSDFTQTLDPWHLALEFAAAPQLDSTFIEDDPPIDRVRALAPAEPDNQQFLVDAYFQMSHQRLMPVFSVPGMTRL